MGNAMVVCCQPMSSDSTIKLIFWEGSTRILAGKKTPAIAGEIMFEFPDRMVCHADSFYIGQPVPALGIEDELITGQTYFVLPLDYFPCNVLSASCFAGLVSNSLRTAINFKDGAPFQYMKGSNGRALIKVSPEFMIKLMTIGKQESSQVMTTDDNSTNLLCSTPELKKHYDMLVGCKSQIWSPKLHTISENKDCRFSPCRFSWNRKGEQEHIKR